MSAGSSGPSVGSIPSSSLGHSRRGHTRSGYRTHAPSALQLSSVDQLPAPEQVSQPATDLGHVNGYAPAPLSHSHSHSHSHSQSHSHSHSHSHPPPSPSHDVGLNYGSKPGAATPPPLELGQSTALGLAGSESDYRYEMASGFLMALPWIALSWYSKGFAQFSPPESSDTVEPVETPAVRLDGISQRTCALAGATMFLIGCGQIMHLRLLNEGANIVLPDLTAKSSSAAFTQVCAIGLPVYAALKLGGFLVAFVLLLASASGLPTAVETSGLSNAARERLGQKKLTVSIVMSAMVLGFLGLNTPWDQKPLMGYVALLASVFLVRPPFFDQLGSASGVRGFTSTEIPSVGSMNQKPSKSVSQSVNSGHAMLSVLSGLLLGFATFVLSRHLSFSALEVACILVISSALAASFLSLNPASIRSPRKFGLALGAGAAAMLCAPPPRDGVFIAYVARGILASVSFVTARFDDRHLRLTAHSHNHHHSHTAASSSKMTKLVLHYSEPYPLLYSILQESDSRRIFYFMSLNFAFMLVQLSYGFLTGSLGLLSDSIHMFFDCLALIVGLCAAVMSKWPPNPRFPHGYGKVDTLSGFANGIFLMIISIEIIYEAVERLSAGSQMNRISELLVVSVAGLAVNLVGIFAFEHGHGHDHGHGHGHSHSHGNENMHGIFLHILADTLGSVAVVISTVLVHYSGWSGFDPIASCLIAILIFVSAIPLVSSTAKTLLLTLPADVEYNVRDTLAGVSTLRGVVGYTVPKFWLDDTATSSAHDHSHDHHDHHHHHDHDHDHDHEKPNQHVLGVIHVIASRGADLDDVRQRTDNFLWERNMDILVQVERDGDGRCWCGGGNKV